MTRSELMARNERIAAMRREGKPVKTISVKFGVSESTVAAVCARLDARLPAGFFRCGHERTEENCYEHGHRVRCRQCKLRTATAYYRRSNEQTPVELERAWGTRP